MRNLAQRVCQLLALLSISLLNFSAAQEDDEEPYLPGLIATYRDSNSLSVQRIDRAISFSRQNRPPDRRLVAGHFTANWQGRLLSQANGAYKLYAYVAGHVRITLNEIVLLEAIAQKPAWVAGGPLDLSYGYHDLRVEYESSEADAQLALYWSGPQFQLEPLDGRQLFHDRDKNISPAFSRGEQLVRALRCGACHNLQGEIAPLAAPALDRVAGAIEPDWLVSWLSDSPTPPSDSEDLQRRMPHFQLAKNEAQAIAAYLLAKSLPRDEKQLSNLRRAEAQKRIASRSTSEKDKKNKKKKAGDDEPAPPPKTPVESGRELVLTVGCLACHQIGELGHSDLFGGGDLTSVAVKRPTNFFELWLASPESLNPQHRMPVFELTGEERRDVAVYLGSLRSADAKPTASATATGKTTSPDNELVAQGERLFAEYQCRTCHIGPGKTEKELPRKTELTSRSNWTKACSAKPAAKRQPQFLLRDSDRAAIREFVSGLSPAAPAVHFAHSLLRERGCMACHWRDDSPGLAPWLTAVAQQYPDLAPQLPAMTPPPLISVGDKLHEQALQDAIRREGKTLRPYLRVRMPKFALTEAELKSLIDELVSADRIPANPPRSVSQTAATPQPKRAEQNVHMEIALDAIGTRLVTPDGFGCTSCHQVGSVPPAKAPLNARGADLTMLGRRIRKEWFDRWVRNPARIVPRMEMPSVQIAVRGVLNEDLDSQLTAVWEVLNRPGFEPPEPNPVRIVRHTGTKSDARAVWISDVVRTKSEIYTKPLLIGLANRHNIIFDLEAARLATWSMGDVARQRTEGKTWFWEAAGKELFRPKWRQTELTVAHQSELALLVDELELEPVTTGQFVTEFDSLRHVENQVEFTHRLRFRNSGHESQIFVKQTFRPLHSTEMSGQGGFRRKIEATGIPPGAEPKLRVMTGEQKSEFVSSNEARILKIGGAGEGVGVQMVLEGDGSLGTKSAVPNQTFTWNIAYITDLVVDQFPLESPAAVPASPSPLNVVPGFQAMRLPLSDEIMPTGLAWRPDGTLVVASLKGQVWLVRDQNGDGLADQLQPFSDDLAAPYGVVATDEYVDVINKYALLRLFDDDRDGRADRTVTIASGWGHTTDYHDWAVGLPRDEQGNYYIALPCQQDDRSIAAAYMRSDFLRLFPRQATADDPRLYGIEVISRGHRFPMGIARNRDGEFFLTDNQGNYNPFNELNHVRPGAHFGFINAIEKSQKDRPPLTAPAIDIPHPWTRSVNGICFLDTPPAKQSAAGASGFGPWEGHLIGCEYDTRRLIRMTLQKVGEIYQGAAYPFSYDQPPSGPPLLGPIVCSVSPDGDLYVGGLRDSGWGGSNNIGEIIRLRFDPSTQPNGIAEMRATATGFTIRFVAPVDSAAGQVDNYSLASYTRESTPAYGGPDVDRRTEKIARVTLSPDSKQVTLELNELRAG
jgi:glucose/arabinose dehydrogenase/cbb3-type cytochrome oxidase cytochrome c subunit